MALARLELDLDVSRQLSNCSIAIQQMVALARALDVSAKLLILDEPTSSLDEREVAELFKVMRKLRGEGLGIVFVTHFMDQVYAVTDRITVLRNGKHIGEYATAELPRLHLVARMIGKEVAEVEQMGHRAKADEIRDGAPLPEVKGLGRKGSMNPIDFSVRPGEVVGLAGLLGSGRTETDRIIYLEIVGGYLYGQRIDILNQGAKVMLLALGMTLVIATGGVDLSVGAVMAMVASMAGLLMVNKGYSFGASLTVALGLSILAGAWNGALVAYLGIQPIIATLILMVAGRGVAQLITDGQIINFTSPTMAYIGDGHFLGLPFTLTVVLVLLAITFCLTRLTALGLFIEAVGDNPTASRYAGVNARLVTFLAYVFTGFCAGLAGLVASSNIKSADATHIGENLELDVILAVVIGGTALTGGRFYLVNSLVGALLIQTLATTMYARNIRPYVAPMPKALVIIAVCLLQSARVRRWLPARPAAPAEPPVLASASSPSAPLSQP